MNEFDEDVSEDVYNKRSMAEKDLDGDVAVAFPGGVRKFSVPNRFDDHMWFQSEELGGGALLFNK